MPGLYPPALSIKRERLQTKRIVRNVRSARFAGKQARLSHKKLQLSLFNALPQTRSCTANQSRLQAAIKYLEEATYADTARKLSF